MYAFLCSKKFYFHLFFFFASLGAFAQNGTLSGTVTTSDGQPAEFVNVALQGTARGTAVNSKGHYQLKNIAPGHYTLVASFTGLVTQTRTVDVSSGQTATADFTLTESTSQLKEVVVSSGRTNKFTRQQSLDVAKLPLKDLENPQVYDVVTSELMKDQQNVNISQALSNVPGAVPSKDPAGGTSFTIRGFTAEVAARNGVQFIGAGRSGVDIVNVDHFEVLKGPSAVLFGNTVSSYGGAINMVTKKPSDTFKGEVGYFIGSNGLSRTTLDINTPLNEDKTLLLRTNAAVNKEQSFLTNGHNNTITFAPTLLYKASDKLTLRFDLEAYQEDLTRTPYLQFGALGITNVNQIPLAYKSTLYDDGLNAVTKTMRTYFEAKYQFNDHWYSQTNVSVNNERVEHSYQYYPTFLDATHIDRQIALYGPITTINSDVQHNLHGDFKTGGLRHRLVWGLDYLHTSTNFDYNFADVDTINLKGTYSAMTKSAADKALLNGSTGNFLSQVNQYATYVSDLVNLTDKLMVMLSARFDRYNQTGEGGYNQNSVTPKFGLIYQPVKDRISIFGNYMSGFTNEGPTVQPDGSVLVLKPEFGTQYEGGVKVSTAGNKVTASLSYYQVDVRNSVRYAGSGFVFQDGSQKSNGIEASIIANPVEGLNLLAGYVYNKNIYTRAETGVGKDVTGTPRNVANFWASYKFQPGSALENLGAGFGGNYAQKSWYDGDNTIAIPSFVLLNATVFYDLPKWRFGLSSTNLTNKHYYSPSFTANPQPLRQFVLNATLKF